MSRDVDALRRATRCVGCEEPSARRMRDWPEHTPAALRAFSDEAGHPEICAECWDAYRRNPRVASEEQTRDALAVLDRPGEVFVRWPYADVDTLAGPLAPGQVYYLAAASGGGKTTFVTGCVARWVELAVPVAVLPLESRPGEWRVSFACQSLGLAPGDALSGRLAIAEAAGHEWARVARQRIRDRLREMRRDPMYQERLYVADDTHVTPAGLRRAARHAREHGFRVLVVDHIDHVGSADGTQSDLSVSRDVNHTLLEVAQTEELVLLPTSQLNASRVRGAKDKLAKYAPPTTQDLYMHTFKEHISAGILGLFRPLKPDVDPDTMAAVRAGLREPTEALEPWTMGVAAMKLRHDGSQEGRRAFLALEDGRPRDRTEAERRDWEARTQGIRTGDDVTMARTSRPVLGVVRGGAAA
jgi:hypothetical protein